MRFFMICAAFVVAANAQFEIGGLGRSGGGSGASPVYGPPEKEFEQKPQPLGPQQPGGDSPQADAYTPQVFRHVFVHAAPDEPEDVQARTIKIPGGDKHVNIIFVKTPSSSSSQQTEVILPEQDEQKNLVYVLLKKAEASSDIKIRRPKAQGPTKPEVYFIQYKGVEQQNGGGPSNGGYSEGPSPPPSRNGGSRPAPQPQPQRPPSNFNFEAPRTPAPAPRPSNGNGGGNGYSEAGVYTPAIVPGPIRSPSDVPSSGYGVPL